jgi:hypothetical protein
MGLMKKAVRRATPRSVRRAKRVVFHPARTAVHAATPRSIRQVKRTAFNIAHPINTAENAFLDSVTGRRSSRSRSSSARSGSYSGGFAATATEERFLIGQEIAEIEQTNFSVHLKPVSPAKPPHAPPITQPDAAPERERIEQDSGAGEIAARLAPLGSPPVVPQQEKVSMRTIRRALYHEETEGVSRWRLKERHLRRTRARKRAVEDAAAETERRAAAHRDEQAAVDAEWARLGQLRELAAAESQRWLVEETARREAARAREQATLDEQWHRLLANDSEAVGAAIRDALGDAPVVVVGMVVGEPTALLAVVVPPRDQAVADREAGYTPTGRPTLHTRSKTVMNELYLGVLGSRLLFATNVALAAAPSLDGVRCVALCIRESGLPEPIYAGTFQRSQLESLKGTVWDSDPGVLSQVPAMAFDAKMAQRGRSRELGKLAFDADGSVDTVMALAVSKL